MFPTEAHNLLTDLRAVGPAAAAASARLVAAPDDLGTDPHAAARAEVAAALLHSLAPTDRPIVAWLLRQEVTAHRAAGAGVSDALLGLVAALARFGQPDDALLLWQAHAATSQTRDAVEVEHLGRAGVERVRTWLREQAHTSGRSAGDARSALAWLDEGRAAGAFDNLAAYFAWSDEAYGLIAGAPV